MKFMNRKRFLVLTLLSFIISLLQLGGGMIVHDPAYFLGFMIGIFIILTLIYFLYVKLLKPQFRTPIEQIDLEKNGAKK